jgi:hypothetical protein
VLSISLSWQARSHRDSSELITISEFGIDFSRNAAWAGWGRLLAGTGTVEKGDCNLFETQSDMVVKADPFVAVALLRMTVVSAENEIQFSHVSEARHGAPGL